MPSTMKLTAITLDCADPKALAAFYRRATGLEAVPESDDDFAGLTREDGLFIGFQRVDDYQAPRWPGQSVPQQLHLDFAVDDLDQAKTWSWSWARPSPSSSRAATGGASLPIRPGTPSAWPGTSQRNAAAPNGKASWRWGRSRHPVNGHKRALKVGSAC